MRRWSTTIGSDNGLSPGRRQAIIWTNAGILFLIGPLGRNFGEILIEIKTFSSLEKMHLKMPSAKFCPFRLGLNVLSCGTNYRSDSDAYGQWLYANHEPIFSLWLNKISAHQRRHYKCNVSSRWPGACSAIHRQLALIRICCGPTWFIQQQGPLLLTRINFNPRMDK